MKAVVCERWGPPEGLTIKDVDAPVPKADEVLVAVAASSVNTQNVICSTGKPYFVRLMGLGLLAPAIRIPGNDLAGRVEAIGKDVTRFKVGDEVFGEASLSGRQTWAEWSCVRQEFLASKPAGVSFAEAAGAGEAALVALHGLRDRGGVQAGQKVLIYGASGGIGSFAVQLAKAFGAEVTGVCSTRNVELVRSLGADHVIDYAQVSYAEISTRYDLIFAIASAPIREHRRALTATGSYVSVGAPSLGRIYEDMLLGPRLFRGGQRLAGGWSVVPKSEDLEVIAGLLEARKIRTVVDRSFRLEEVADAVRYYSEGRARGKVIISLPSDAVAGAQSRGQAH